MVDPDLVVQYAREALGTPYRHQGRLVGQALDCIGLAIYVAQRLNLPYTDLPAYGQTPHKGLLQEMTELQPCLERVSQRQKGDLLLMKFTYDPQHMAICAGDTIIHCAMDTGRVVENRIDADTERRIVAVYRFRGQ